MGGGNGPSLLPPGATSPSHWGPSHLWTLSQPPPHSPWGTATLLCTHYQTHPPQGPPYSGQNYGGAPGTCSVTSDYRSHPQWHQGSSRCFLPTNTTGQKQTRHYKSLPFTTFEHSLLWHFHSKLHTYHLHHRSIHCFGWPTSHAVPEIGDVQLAK